MIYEICEDNEAVEYVRQLEINLSPQERFWFANLLGPRPSKKFQGA